MNLKSHTLALRRWDPIPPNPAYSFTYPKIGEHIVGFDPSFADLLPTFPSRNRAGQAAYQLKLAQGQVIPAHGYSRNIVTYVFLGTGTMVIWHEDAERTGMVSKTLWRPGDCLTLLANEWRAISCELVCTSLLDKTSCLAMIESNPGERPSRWDPDVVTLTKNDPKAISKRNLTLFRPLPVLQAVREIGRPAPVCPELAAMFARYYAELHA
jgi:hypothetical protein